MKAPSRPRRNRVFAVACGVLAYDPALAIDSEGKGCGGIRKIKQVETHVLHLEEAVKGLAIAGESDQVPVAIDAPNVG